MSSSGAISERARTAWNSSTSPWISSMASLRVSSPSLYSSKTSSMASSTPTAALAWERAWASSESFSARSMPPCYPNSSASRERARPYFLAKAP